MRGYAHLHARHPKITGQRFGMLVVLGRLPNTDKNSRWACRCDCGNLTAVRRTALVSGATIACGCRMIRRPGDIPLGPKRPFHPPRDRRWKNAYAVMAGIEKPPVVAAPGRVHTLWGDEP